MLKGILYTIFFCEEIRRHPYQDKIVIMIRVTDGEKTSFADSRPLASTRDLLVPVLARWLGRLGRSQLAEESLHLWPDLRNELEVARFGREIHLHQADVREDMLRSPHRLAVDGLAFFTQDEQMDPAVRTPQDRNLVRQPDDWVTDSEYGKPLARALHTT